MKDLSEKETFEYFTHGLKKASTAALKLAKFNERSGWHKIVRLLDQLSYNGGKLYEKRTMNRLQTLALATKIQNETMN